MEGLSPDSTVDGLDIESNVVELSLKSHVPLSGSSEVYRLLIIFKAAVRNFLINHQPQGLWLTTKDQEIARVNDSTFVQNEVRAWKMLQIRGKPECFTRFNAISKVTL